MVVFAKNGCSEEYVSTFKNVDFELRWVLRKEDIYFIQTNSCTLFKTHSHLKH